MIGCAIAVVAAASGVLVLCSRSHSIFMPVALARSGVLGTGIRISVFALAVVIVSSCALVVWIPITWILIAVTVTVSIGITGVRIIWWAIAVVENPGSVVL